MIDFKNLVRVKKFTLEDGDIFLLDLNSNDIKKLFDDSKKGKDIDPEEFALLSIDRMLCDENGKLLNFSQDDLEAMPRSLIRDITECASGLITGKKKANT